MNEGFQQMGQEYSQCDACYHGKHCGKCDCCEDLDEDEADFDEEEDETEF